MQDNYLESYLSNGVERIIKEMIKLSVTSPGKGAFFLRFAAAEKKARLLRQVHEQKGTHIPPFLIASITTQCNLRCQGCYAYANQGCGQAPDKQELTKSQWGSIFNQAETLGISFILLAGGEPLTRTEILEEAATHKRILFPIFTNGTLLNENTLPLFAAHHNLLPVISLEGDEERTDARRGSGIYQQVERRMKQLAGNKILFGTAVTVTAANQDEVLSDSFVRTLSERGCRAVIYVDYVPADRKSVQLALSAKQRLLMAERLQELRHQETDLLFLSFPGDEKASGGCLAAGRGFFHINALGGAEPCPFSPYSDTDVIHTGLKETLASPLFVKIRTGPLLAEEHHGGCVLFEKEEQVKSYWRGAVL